MVQRVSDITKKETISQSSYDYTNAVIRSLSWAEEARKVLAAAPSKGNDSYLQQMIDTRDAIAKLRYAQN